MADQEATLYYVSRQFFNFEKACNYFESSGLFIHQPETNLIYYAIKSNDFTIIDQKKVHDLVYIESDIGIKLWLNSDVYVFWSFVQADNYFFQNFSLYLLEDLSKEKVCKFLIRYTLLEIAEINEEIVGFVIDQYDFCEYGNVEPFLTGQNETLNCCDLPELLFLPQNKVSQIILDNESQLFEINQNFACVAKNPDLLNFTKNLLSKK